jgi:type IV pilus assembly protein PilY1
MMARLTQFFVLAAVALANVMLVSFPQSARAEDTDIFTVNPAVTSLRPNVLIIQDNSANWNTPFTAEKAALVSTVQGLDDRFNVGLMSFVETGGGNTNVDGSYMRAAVRQMTTANKAALAGLVNSFDILADKSNNAVYGLTMAEAYRYFGGRNATTGQVKRDAAGNSVSGFSSAVASNAVFARPGNAFTSMASNTYVSPIADNCAKNFIIFISNGPANDNSNATGDATTALSGYGGSTAEIALSPNGSQSNVADEWARFMANSDVNPTLNQPQNVYTYTVDVNPGTTGQGPGHTALLKSMALQGKGKYFAVTGNSADIADALNKIFQEVLATNSVFASAALPVSVSARGTFLNQVYMGVFRPDGQASPRWAGNLKQFALAPNAAQNLEVVDRNGDAVAQPDGFLKSTITSYWTTASTFWDAAYYPDAQVGLTPTSDAPDGNLVEKGGAAERLRNTYATDVSTTTVRKLFTCVGICAAGATLTDAAHAFHTSNTALVALPTSTFGISGVSSISSLTRSGTTATATTSAAHGFATGQSVTIAGANGAEYNGLFTVTVTDSTHFTFVVAENPTSPATGTITMARPVASFTIASLGRAAASGDATTGNTDTATATTTAAHGLAAGNSVTLSGANQAEYNGTFTVLTAPTATSFTFAVPIGPVTPATLSGASNAQFGTTNLPISNIVRVGKTVTVTAGSGSNKVPGATNSTGLVTITNIVPAAYEGAGITYTNTGNFSFRYTLGSLSPSASATGAIVGSGSSTSVTLTSLTRAAGTSTAVGTTSATHGLSIGDSIVISGAAQAAFNGTFSVATVNAAAKQFTYNVVVSPASPDTSTTMTASVSGTTNKSDLINWVRGENRQLNDNPSVDPAANTYVRGYLHGDVVHSRPAIINYNRTTGNRDIAVFYGTNDGIFHAVKGGQNDADGGELWGFVMPEHFSKLGRQYSAVPVINNASATAAKPYFADGPISTLLIDANDDGAINSATTGDKAYIYVGMRRGGRQLYAFDVTDPTSPKVLWRIDNNTAGFSELGDTWGEAKVGKIAGYANHVLVLSAGYDAVANDSTTQGTATMGRGVYIIDAITGAPVWYAGPAAISGVTSTVVPGMNYAIAADATPIDSDREGYGYIDRIYLADTGGNIWRANVSAVTSGGAPDFTNWTVSKIAALGGTGANARKFLFAPDVVAFDNAPTTTDSILIGSGDREHPFDVAITNRFYMVKDDHALTANASVATPLGEGDLCDLTADNLQGSDATLKAASAACVANTAKKGWFITMGTGEKVVTNSVTVNSTTAFGTNVPESTLDHTNTCSSGLGEARLYSVNFRNATSVIDQQPDGLLGPNDRYSVNRGGGLPPPPVAISTIIGGKPYEAICSGPSCIPPSPGPYGRRTRVFWNILNETN